ncbi:DUF2809 domain-containing protein [Agromyces sp. CFH 90414]|uniref:DUF2809 domain-containing protein n=1 Tax=Agromyces agglutinans TaxID=2662258 RepID=A0A6I2F5X9_9MICO|nr:DUF2809 domain-containing protein [Agromyces agglutinans]MRG59691.1 DUF2809 domain-containing protein [Agromyces agglutinans]
MPRAPRSTARVRLFAAIGIAASLGIGLGLQLLDRNAWIDAAGGILYVALVGLLVLLVAPRLPAWAVAAIALGVAVAVELLQLTGIPAAIVAAVPPARLVFGSSFDPWDLVAYVAGAAILWAVVAVAGFAARQREASV